MDLVYAFGRVRIVQPQNVAAGGVAQRIQMIFGVLNEGDGSPEFFLSTAGPRSRWGRPEEIVKLQVVRRLQTVPNRRSLKLLWQELEALREQLEEAETQNTFEVGPCSATCIRCPDAYINCTPPARRMLATVGRIGAIFYCAEVHVTASSDLI